MTTIAAHLRKTPHPDPNPALHRRKSAQCHHPDRLANEQASSAGKPPSGMDKIIESAISQTSTTFPLVH